MKYFKLFLTIFLISPAASATPKLAIVIGGKSPEILWLEKKSSGTRPVHVLGFQTFSKTRVERVIPHSEFAKISKELSNWKEILAKNLNPIDSPLCPQEVTFFQANEKSEICIERILNSERTKFFKWFRTQADLAVGRY